MAFRTNKMPVLQEKSASGSVASFNTALAMPLASCNIAVNAWQEGSGDPSPSNVRPIHGFSEVNTYQRGINLWDEEWELGAYSNQTGEKGVSNVHIRCKNLIPIKGGVSYFVRFNSSALVVLSYDRNGDFIGVQKSLSASGIVAPSNRVAYFAFYTTGTTYNNDISINYPSTDTDYHAYTGNTYTIQLGQEVYGAEVDVNGVAHITHKKDIFDGTQDIELVNWQPQANSVGFAIFTSEQATIPSTIYYIADIISDKLKSVDYATVYGNDICSIALSKRFDLSVLFFRVTDTSLTTRELVKTWLSNNNIAVVYPLANPFDIQLTPQQIKTLIGNNTIFADTGDVDLTFKDLDIAKRGNFHEVFKLPS